MCDVYINVYMKSNDFKTLEYYGNLRFTHIIFCASGQ